MMHFLTKATPISTIDDRGYVCKERKQYNLFNQVSRFHFPLVTNDSLGGGHTHMHTSERLPFINTLPKWCKPYPNNHTWNPCEQEM